MSGIVLSLWRDWIWQQIERATLLRMIKEMFSESTADVHSCLLSVESTDIFYILQYELLLFKEIVQ